MATSLSVVERPKLRNRHDDVMSRTTCICNTDAGKVHNQSCKTLRIATHCVLLTLQVKLVVQSSAGNVQDVHMRQ